MSLRKILTVATVTAAAALTPVAAFAADGAAASGVEIVKAGQPVSAGHAATMTLTRTERCVDAGIQSTCKSVVDGNQAYDSVSLQTFGDATGTLYSPLYIGDGKAARMTVEADGVTYDVQVVRLAGHSGYSTGYVWGAPEETPPSADTVEVTVYNAAGKVLASL